MGINSGIQTRQLQALSDMTGEFSKANWYKPFVGPTVSNVEVGIATRLMWDHRDEPGMGRAEFLNYETVGGKSVTLVMGKKSGRYSIMLKSYELGLALPSEEQANKILDQVKDISIEKKGLVADDEFKRIYQEIMAANN